MKERYTIRLAVFVCFEKAGKILLSLRKNTGYHDGDYGVIQGHVEAGEDIKAAAIREAEEEAGVLVKPEDLELMGIVHDREGIPYMQFIFKCKNWSGEIANKEPHCCAGLEWFDKDKLPDNTIAKTRDFIRLDGTEGLVERH